MHDLTKFGPRYNEVCNCVIQIVAKRCGWVKKLFKMHAPSVAARRKVKLSV